MYERLYSVGVVLKCLENYEIENIDYRDQEMAKKFLNIIKESKDNKNKGNESDVRSFSRSC